MGEFPDRKKSASEGSVPEGQLDEATWQKWIDKGKARDIARRKRLFLALWFFLPALVLLSLWALASRP
jgi:hypothetical protein